MQNRFYPQRGRSCPDCDKSEHSLCPKCNAAISRGVLYDLAWHAVEIEPLLGFASIKMLAEEAEVLAADREYFPMDDLVVKGEFYRTLAHELVAIIGDALGVDFWAEWAEEYDRNHPGANTNREGYPIPQPE